MNLKVLTLQSVQRRAKWVLEIQNISGNFGDDSTRVEEELASEIKGEGLVSLVDHLRLCGAIPECYGHDSSEEKLYSKYTDTLLALAFRKIGLNSYVLTERGDSADVECVANSFEFVADAKAFRLSRTAKNQKDFKVAAMHNWKRGKPYAMVVCPVYQLPSRASQIYAQASHHNVCIFTYCHLCVLLAYCQLEGSGKTNRLLHEIFRMVEATNPSKDASNYWNPLNRAMLDFSPYLAELWQTEKIASQESIWVAKEEGLTYLAAERRRIARMTRKEAIQELIREHNIDSKIKVIQGVADTGILNLISP